MIVGPLGFYTVGKDLITTLEAQIGGLNRVGMVPGAIAWDQCECGMLAGSVSRIYYTESFPVESTATSCQNGILAAEIVLQLLRCSPAPNGMNETAPSTAELDQNAQDVTADGWTMLTTVACRLAAMEDNRDIMQYLVRPLVFAGPMGMCAGSELVVVVALPNRAG